MSLARRPFNTVLTRPNAATPTASPMAAPAALIDSQIERRRSVCDGVFWHLLADRPAKTVGSGNASRQELGRGGFDRYLVAGIVVMSM
jgi:hypothetical protein